MTFRVPVVRIDRVEDHPNNPNSTVTHFFDRYYDEVDMVHQAREYQVVSSRLKDGSPRYKHGDAAIFFPGNSIVPEDFLEFIGYGDMKGGRVKAGNFQKIMSDGILSPVTVHLSESGAHISDTITFPDNSSWNVRVGDDLKHILGVTQFVAK